MPSIVYDVPLRHVSKRQRNIPTNKRAIPCPISPNITPKRKGKVTHVK